MIDKLDQAVSPWVPLRGVYSEIYSELHRGQTVPFARRGGSLYSWKVDLRKVPDESAKLNGFLYLGNRQNGGHKLELFDVGKTPISRVFDDTEKVFDGDPLVNSITRMDLATDIDDVPPVWFRSHARVQFKQFGADFSEVTVNLQSAEMGKRKYETLYYGKRPNCIRVYDKTAELLNQYRVALRGLSKSDKGTRAESWAALCSKLSLTDEELDGIDLVGNWLPVDYEPFESSLSDLREGEKASTPEPRPLPSFSEFASTHGFDGMTLNTILTRVERQIGGSRFPEHFLAEDGKATLSTIWNRLKQGRQGVLYDPFERLHFEGAGELVKPCDSCGHVSTKSAHPDPSIDLEIGARDFLVIRGLQALVSDVGVQRARQMLNARSQGNGGRLLQKYADYIPAMKERPDTDNLVAFSRDVLFEKFRDSITKQFAA